jgi:hypothetical protein
MGVTNFPGGLASFGLPVLPGLPFTTGTVYFVCNATNANGSDGNSGLRPDQPLATLAKALTLVTASKGDTIVVMPGHAETTTAVALSVAGVTVVGVGFGRLKPAFTATTAASDLFAVSAANVTLINLRLVGAASGSTALLDINGADFYGYGLVFEHGAAPLNAVTVPASAHRFILEDCQWRGTAAGCDKCVIVEGKTDDWKIIRPRADYGGSSGLDDAFFFSSFKMKGYQIIDPVVVGFDTLTIDINSSSAAVGDGVVLNGTSVASAGITVANAIDAGGCVFVNHQIADSVAAKGLAIPTATPT